MSKVAKPPVKSGAPPPVKPGTSKSSMRKSSAGSIKKTVKTPKPKKKEEPPKPPEWTLPAFSLLPRKKEGINWELLKNDVARRHAPEGEDMKGIKRILKEVERQTIPVHNFINLIGPYTSDNGAVLRAVMAEDVESFQKLARKVYETMTQDVSDVLVNEQLHMMQYYQEKYDTLSAKIMRAINEIFDMVPNFDFEKFFRDREEYLNFILPLPEEIQLDSEDMEMRRRQEAYHRLQWLRSEGDRMSEENRRLQQRLEELKLQQEMEQQNASEMAADAEAKRQELVQEEIRKKEAVEKLNQSVEKSFIETEAQISKTHNVTAMQPATGAVKKKAVVQKKKKKVKKAEWVDEVAVEMEDTAMQEVIATEAGAVPPAKSVKQMRKAAGQRQGQAPKEKSPFHFSPLKDSVPPPAPKEKSPFHYSPPQAQAQPVQREKSPFHFSPLKDPLPPPPPKEKSPFHYSPPQAPAQPVQREKSPFHFSPLQPPPPPVQKQKSPFHFSPDQAYGGGYVTPPALVQQVPPQQPPFRYSPEAAQSGYVAPPAPVPQAQQRKSPFRASPEGAYGGYAAPPAPQIQDTRIEEVSTTVQQKRVQPQTQQQIRTRRGVAPKDQWGGFY